MIDETVFNKLTEPIKDLQIRCNTDILSVIMRKIAHIKNESDIKNTAQYDDGLLEINKIKNDYESKMQRAIETAILDIALLAYNDCDDLYDEPHTELSRKLLGVSNELITALLLIYYGLNSEYYVKIFNPKAPAIKSYIPLESAYNQILDKAINAKKSNLDFDTVMHDVETDLINGGLKVYNSQGYYNADSGYEALVSQALVETAQKVYDEVGIEVKSNGVEISAHLAPAPDHAPCQGHQFSNQNWNYIQSGLDFEDIQGRKYIGFDRHIGTCNCKHLTKPIIVGVTKPTYDDAKLTNVLKANERGYTTKNGKHYTFYECTQKLNYFRRNMKKCEQGIELAKIADNKKLLDKYTQSYNHYKQMYELFNVQLNKRLYTN